MKDKLKIALLANTGIGNEVFSTLKKHPQVIIDSVLTRKFDGDYPYFKTKELVELVMDSKVRCFYNVEANTEYFEYLKYRQIDLIIVATFHQIIRENIIRLPKLGIINFHPSLLPKYRGPSPISWALLKGETKTGITIHKLSQGIDSGDVIKQESIDIFDIDNLSTLIEKLSTLAGKMTFEVIEDFLSGNTTAYAQNESEASYFKRPHKERYFDQGMNFRNVFNTIRAFHPFPGAILIDNQNKEFLVEDYSLNGFNKLNDPKKSNEKILYFGDKVILLIVKPIM